MISALVRCISGVRILSGAAFDAGARGDRGQPLEGVDELRAAIGIAGVVERVDADDQRVGARATSAHASASDRKIVLRAGT